MIVAYLSKSIDPGTMHDLSGGLSDDYSFTFDVDSECIVIVRAD